MGACKIDARCEGPSMQHGELGHGGVCSLLPYSLPTN